MVKYKVSEARQSVGSHTAQSRTCFVTGTVTVQPKQSIDKKGETQTPQRFPGGSIQRFPLKPCLACDDGSTNSDVLLHNVTTCNVWNSLGIKDKEAKVKCKKHPFSIDHKTADCQRAVRACKICQEKSHHFLLCPKKRVATNTSLTKSMIGSSELPPVMVQTSFVSIGRGMKKLGAMWDLCSTDDYITHKVARRLGLQGTDVELVVEGIKGVEHVERTKLYDVPVLDMKGTSSIFQCYGLDVISSAADPPDKLSYQELCGKFGIDMEEVRKPKNIDLLISMRRNPHHPRPVKTIGNMTLYEGAFGKVFGGSDKNLMFTLHKTSYPARVLEIDRLHIQTMRAAVKSATQVASARTEKDFLDFFKEDNIGVGCNPKCGGCRCGQCPVGAKPMSLKDEREYEKFKSNLTYEEQGTQDDPGPYWRTSYPWNIDKRELVDNVAAVLGVMNATKRKLKKDPLWEEVYETQLRDLISRGFAREVSEDEVKNWKKDGGRCYYIAHQMALNPGSKSTPGRVVYNSSQMYKGYSLNSSWDLGPDVMSNLHGVLLRFRKDQVGGQGDMTKMFYMVRVTKEEEMCQLFVWQFKGEDTVRIFCMTRLVMGNKPSGNISIVAVKETAKMNDFEKRYPIAYQALTFDSYVDNVFLTAPDAATLLSGIKEIEMVAKQGGFKFKEWIISGEDIPEQMVSIKLPNAIAPEEKKALGVFWDVRED